MLLYCVITKTRDQNTWLQTCFEHDQAQRGGEGSGVWGGFWDEGSTKEVKKIIVNRETGRRSPPSDLSVARWLKYSDGLIERQRVKHWLVTKKNLHRKIITVKRRSFYEIALSSISVNFSILKNLRGNEFRMKYAILFVLYVYILWQKKYIYIYRRVG